MSNAVHPFKVGQIFYNSWGYDQTNIDFYQVIEIKPKSIVVQRIEIRISHEAFMSGIAKPIPFEFKGNGMLKKVQVRWNPGADEWEYSIKMEHGSTNLLTPEEAERGLYCSWGH